ncbi:MAG: hypothetical protein FE78DRAFT_116442, partial [Acidomyces sp. 'richmondensis']
MPAKRANVAKRACDGCKIRKIRCGGGDACKACVIAGIRCTYIKVQQPRGPRRMRSTTRLLIEQAQRGDISPEGQPPQSPADGHETVEAQYGSQSFPFRISTNILIPALYIYHVRMFPVWPIVNVEEVVAALQTDSEAKDFETHALATAIASATFGQLRLDQSSLSNSTVTTNDFATACLRARNMWDYKAQVNLNTVRTSFFLHVYYENQDSGGSQSLLYLREAITSAQMMGLHRESSYADLSLEEKQIRRRVLWLLFVTERGVCILHQFPVVLSTNIQAPEVDGNDESQVLPAFLKLLNLFRIFDHAKIFDIIQGDSKGATTCKLERDFFDTLQRRLQEGNLSFDQMPDVQKADVCVTKHWMRMILWRLSSKKGPLCRPAEPRPMSVIFPVIVAKEFLNMVSQLPHSAVEAHGIGMQLKIYEIANSVVDAISDL